VPDADTDSYTCPNGDTSSTDAHCDSDRHASSTDANSNSHRHTCTYCDSHCFSNGDTERGGSTEHQSLNENARSNR